MLTILNVHVSEIDGDWVFFQGPEWQTGENFECRPHIILMAIVQTPLQETK